MTQAELNLILAAHAEWLAGSKKGKRANLSGCDLRRADLREADLSEADLSEANLRGADLRGADLRGANLRGCDLSGCDLRWSDLSGCDHVIGAGYPDGWHTIGWHIEGAIQVRVGCRSMSLAEGRTYWADKENRREVLAALDYIEAVAKLREWK